MFLIFAKILSVFGISLFGYIGNKLKWFPEESTKYFSLLLVNITSPCLVIYSMSQEELTKETLSSVVQTAGFMLLALIITTVISILCLKIMRAPMADRGVYRFLLVLTNCGFMGFPLSLAVFGKKGLFLMIIANAVFTFYAYSVGVIMLVSGSKSGLTVKTAAKSLVSIPVVTSIIGILIFIFGISLPSLLTNFLEMVGNITVPLSMIIIGIQLAESKAMEILTNRHLFEIIILKLIAIPAALFGIFLLIPVNPFVLCLVVFAMSMPSAAISPVLSELHGVNARLAAQGVFITTLFSLISIPVTALLLNLFLGA
ncbi:MAG TPA: AEC family transporter [Bacillota bacterium]|nr:AEC family transporter [Bacillota bacterium]